MRSYLRRECRFTGLLNAVPSLEQAKELFIVADGDLRLTKGNVWLCLT
jgi:hypothetical protein